MVTVYLYGSLKDKFGESFTLDAQCPAEVVKALTVQLPGFEREVRAGSWHVLRGPVEDQNSDNKESLTLAFGETTEMHLMPAIEGAQNGVLQTIVGIVLIIVGAIWYQPLVAVGVGMLVGGIVAMTTKIPTMDETQGEDERTSFLFSGTTNNSNQGAAIPRGYGRMLTGSVLVSAGITAEQLLHGGEVPNWNYFEWTAYTGYSWSFY